MINFIQIQVKVASYYKVIIITAISIVEAFLNEIEVVQISVWRPIKSTQQYGTMI